MDFLLRAALRAALNKKSIAQISNTLFVMRLESVKGDSQPLNQNIGTTMAADAQAIFFVYGIEHQFRLTLD